MSTFNGTDRLMQYGVDQNVFPGAVLWVTHHGRLVHCNAYGRADLFSGRAMTVESVFDLASLTKPLATSLAVMILVQQGALNIDRALGDQWPVVGDAQVHITARHLLSHSSGLPAWRPYFMRLRHLPAKKRLRIMRQWLINEPLPTGSRHLAIYSDLGFLLLQWLVEDIAGMRLDRFVEKWIYRPMGLHDLFFIDLQEPRPIRSYAATELCPWRNRLLSGEVHDDNAHVLGGVAGHAGLFGTAAAVGQLLQALLAAEHERAVDFPFHPDLVSAFFQHQPDSTWALGFDTPSPADSSAGKLFSSSSVGHLGYTGTSFWMDRREEIIIVLLTNRVHPSRHNWLIKKFRPKLHDEVMLALKKNQAVV